MPGAKGVGSGAKHLLPKALRRREFYTHPQLKRYRIESREP